MGAAAEELRSLLSRFEAAGLLTRIPAPVASRFELPAICTHAHQSAGLEQQVLLFEQVDDSAFPVVGNLCSTREKIAFALNIEPARLLDRGVEAIEHPISPIVVSKAPCQEVVIE